MEKIKQKSKKNSKEFYKKNKEEVSLKSKERYKKLGKEKKQKYYIINRKKILSNLKERIYGITDVKYQDILSQQNFVCAICKNPEKVKHNRKTISLLAVDHDHETGKIRGLLCSRCNQGLGHFDDNPEKLRSGIKYLEMFNRQY